MGNPRLPPPPRIDLTAPVAQGLDICSPAARLYGQSTPSSMPPSFSSLPSSLPVESAAAGLRAQYPASIPRKHCHPAVLCSFRIGISANAALASSFEPALQTDLEAIRSTVDEDLEEFEDTPLGEMLHLMARPDSDASASSATLDASSHANSTSPVAVPQCSLVDIRVSPADFIRFFSRINTSTNATAHASSSSASRPSADVGVNLPVPSHTSRDEASAFLYRCPRLYCRTQYVTDNLSHFRRHLASCEASSSAPQPWKTRTCPVTGCSSGRAGKPLTLQSRAKGLKHLTDAHGISDDAAVHVL